MDKKLFQNTKKGASKRSGEVGKVSPGLEWTGLRAAAAARVLPG